MNKLIIAAIAGAFAMSAGAQAPAPASDVKAKQEMVKSTTQAATKGENVKAAEGSAAAAATKGHPKALPHKAAKRETVTAATGSTSGKGANITAAEGSARAAADKSPRKPPPKPTGLDQTELKKAATP